jgi:hypothetical protein
MSDAEKSEQIGEAMLLLEQQKRELAHLAAKIERVRQAYHTFSRERDRWRVDERPSHPKVYLHQPSLEERELAASLLSAEELGQLVMAFDQAEGKVKQTKETLSSFGITNL